MPLLFPSLTCIVMHSCPSKCIVMHSCPSKCIVFLGAVNRHAFVAVFVSIAGEVDFVRLVIDAWNATAVDGRRCG